MTRVTSWMAAGFVGLCLGLTIGTVPLSGAQKVSARERPLHVGPVKVVHADPGGPLEQRHSEVRALQASGDRVELRGICNSACTMYLGLDNVCIDRGASFGFHGPSSYGRPLPASEFERWSQIMARNYREPLKSWFLDTARHDIAGHKRLSGGELIRMGYPEC